MQYHNSGLFWHLFRKQWESQHDSLKVQYLPAVKQERHTPEENGRSFSHKKGSQHRKCKNSVHPKFSMEQNAESCIGSTASIEGPMLDSEKHNETSNIHESIIISWHVNEKIKHPNECQKYGIRWWLLITSIKLNFEIIYAPDACHHRNQWRWRIIQIGWLLWRHLPQSNSSFLHELIQHIQICCRVPF